jgi:carbamoyl-phosphate synthase large subunit
MRILVTGAGALLGQGIIRSLKKSSLSGLKIIAADPSTLSAGLYWADEYYLLPKATDANFIEGLTHVIKQSSPDLIIPGTDVELMILSLNSQKLELEHGVKVLVSDPRVIEIADDKYKTFEFFRDNGFTPPESCLPGDEKSLIEKVGFPLIVKPRNGARSIGVCKVNNLQELNQAIRTTQRPVIQECVGNDDVEYTAGALYFDGECNATIVMRRDLRDGNTYRAYVDKSTELNEQVNYFARKLKPFGPVNFQFRLCNGNVKVFEINGRFSGTTPLRMHAGFNEVELCVRYLLCGETIKQPEISQITILRHWSETIINSDTTPPKKYYG